MAMVSCLNSDIFWRRLLDPVSCKTSESVFEFLPLHEKDLDVFCRIKTVCGTQDKLWMDQRSTTGRHAIHVQSSKVGILGWIGHDIAIVSHSAALLFLVVVVIGIDGSETAAHTHSAQGEANHKGGLHSQKTSRPFVKNSCDCRPKAAKQ